MAECPNLLWSEDGQGSTAQQAIDAIKPTIESFYNGTLTDSGIEAINTHSQIREVAGRQVILSHHLDEGTYHVIVPSVEHPTVMTNVSSAELVASDDQSLLINDWMAGKRYG